MYVAMFVGMYGSLMSRTGSATDTGATQPSGAPRHFLRSGPLPSDLK